MIQVGTARNQSTTSGLKPDCLVLNGQLIKDSSVFRSSHGLIVTVYDETAGILLIQCRLVEIATHFARLTVPLPEVPNESFSYTEIVFRDDDGTKASRLDFTFDPDDEHWAKPWSIADYASTLGRVVEHRSVPGLQCRPRHESLLEAILKLRVELHTPEGSVQQSLDYWVPIIRDICEEVEALLAASVRNGTLVALFNFAPEVKTACEQYLLYFVQFLEDLGIRATADLQQQARGVLFTVTPESGPEALERIREALDLYLQIPGSPDFDAEVTRHRDVAVQQLAANVLHLHSQLMLTQAILETKNATIENLQAANLQYRQILSTNPQNQGQLPGPRSDDPQKDEPIFGGAASITPLTLKGLQVNLPFIFRKLRRRFRGEE